MFAKYSRRTTEGHRADTRRPRAGRAYPGLSPRSHNRTSQPPRGPVRGTELGVILLPPREARTSGDVGVADGHDFNLKIVRTAVTAGPAFMRRNGRTINRRLP